MFLIMILMLFHAYLEADIVVGLDVHVWKKVCQMTQ